MAGPSSKIPFVTCRTVRKSSSVQTNQTNPHSLYSERSPLNGCLNATGAMGPNTNHSVVNIELRYMNDPTVSLSGQQSVSAETSPASVTLASAARAARANNPQEV